MDCRIILSPWLKPGAKKSLLKQAKNRDYKQYVKIKGKNPPSHVKYMKDVYVWSEHLKKINNFEIIRKYYYTSVKGDSNKIEIIEDDLKNIEIEAPRVFKKTKDKGSKRVDISLATDMLTHAHRKNYNIAVLVAGDEDYVPLTIWMQL